MSHASARAGTARILPTARRARSSGLQLSKGTRKLVMWRFHTRRVTGACRTPGAPPERSCARAVEPSASARESATAQDTARLHHRTPVSHADPLRPDGVLKARGTVPARLRSRRARVEERPD